MNRYLLDNRRPEAGERFEALATLFDPWTFRHLDDLGLGEGWRCSRAATWTSCSHR